MQHHPGSPAATNTQRPAQRAALMPGADDGALRLITGQAIDTHAPWPFPELTAAQRAELEAFASKRDAGHLRGLPSCFGDLA